MKSFGQRRPAAAEPAEINAITPSNTVEHVDVEVDDADQKKSADFQHAAALAVDYVEGSAAEKKLLRKLDYRLLVRSPRQILWKQDS